MAEQQEIMDAIDRISTDVDLVANRLANLIVERDMWRERAEKAEADKEVVALKAERDARKAHAYELGFDPAVPGSDKSVVIPVPPKTYPGFTCPKCGSKKFFAFKRQCAGTFADGSRCTFNWPFRDDEKYGLKPLLEHWETVVIPVPPKTPPGFTCPECGSKMWGTSGPMHAWRGYCTGQAHGGPQCSFTWPRRTDDEKYGL